MADIEMWFLGCNEKFISNMKYTNNNSIESMTKNQFMYWLMSKDQELYDFLKLSNLYGFIDGKLYMSMENPNDFKLVDTNEHILNKLLLFKN